MGRREFNRLPKQIQDLAFESKTFFKTELKNLLIDLDQETVFISWT